MFWLFVLALLVLDAHFSFTANAPAEEGKAWALWPFAADTHPRLAAFGSSPGTLAQLLSMAAGVAFMLAAFSLIGWVIPASWWLGCVLCGITASSALFLVYFSPWALLPLGINAVLLLGVLFGQWSVSGLRGI